jgi:hypothetical protein
MFNKRGAISLLQIFILLIGIFAFSILSSGFVSGGREIGRVFIGGV